MKEYAEGYFVSGKSSNDASDDDDSDQQQEIDNRIVDAARQELSVLYPEPTQDDQSPSQPQ